ncbi:phosphatases II [Gyrodon lividus]|nr:phosphatases II [Gyrodon lividus]
MTSNLSTTLPPWLTEGCKAARQHLIFTELSKREYERSKYRNSPPTASPKLKLSSPFKPEKNEHSKHYSVAIGRDPTNRRANRYSNIEPYDRTRVVVGASENTSLGCGDCNGRYFNGSWVRELHGGKWWIATQAPLLDTAHAFLSVLKQPIGPSSDTPLPTGSCIRTVVQLTLNHENGRAKACPYFPSKVGEYLTVTPESGIAAPRFQVALQEQKHIDEANCVKSKVSVISEGDVEPLVFTHMLYTAWPDHGIPEEEDEASLLRFLRLVDQVNKKPRSDGAGDDPGPPIMANCSAGIGRTGTFIALSSLLRYYNLLGSSSSSSPDTSRAAIPTRSLLGPISGLKDDPVVQEVDNLREQRPGMIQRNEQIALIYQILEQAFLG